MWLTDSKKFKKEKKSEGVVNIKIKNKLEACDGAIKASPSLTIDLGFKF